VADAIFENRRLAGVYDPLDPDRSDLDAYLALAEGFGARQVLDIGCGTGTFACLLAGRGIDVVGVDPAAASLDVARAKPGGDRVRWIHGDVGPVQSWVQLTEVRGDLVTFRGTVVFEADGAVLTSDSTLRFRGRDQVTRSLLAAGFSVDEVRDAPDRPGREFVFIATRAD
jgi:SAM-dependent methyltransferase